MKQITGRIDSEKRVGKETYIRGLLDITSFLVVELKDLMKEENRYFGVIPKYFTSLYDSYSKIDSTIHDESEIVELGRILYLFKPILISQYRWLKNKLSPADADIVLINKLLGIVSDIKGDSYYQHQEELDEISSIIGRMFKYIRNDNKNNSLFLLSETIKNCMSSGYTGKYPLDKFSLGEYKKEKEILQNTENRLGQNNIVEEISL